MHAGSPFTPRCQSTECHYSWNLIGISEGHSFITGEILYDSWPAWWMRRLTPNMTPSLESAHIRAHMKALSACDLGQLSATVKQFITPMRLPVRLPGCFNFQGHLKNKHKLHKWIRFYSRVYSLWVFLSQFVCRLVVYIQFWVEISECT